MEDDRSEEGGGAGGSISAFAARSPRRQTSRLGSGVERRPVETLVDRHELVTICVIKSMLL